MQQVRVLISDDGEFSWWLVIRSLARANVKNACPTRGKIFTPSAVFSQTTFSILTKRCVRYSNVEDELPLVLWEKLTFVNTCTQPWWVF